MKLNKIILSLSILAFTVCLSYNVDAQCKAKQIAKSGKGNIKKPYAYDSYSVTNFALDTKAKNIEVVFNAFKGEKYQLVFCSSGFDEPVTLNIYDKSNRVKKGRTKLYDNSQGIDNSFWTFEPTKSGNYYIEYSVPVSKSDKVKAGCIVMLVGFIPGQEGDDD